MSDHRSTDAILHSDALSAARREAAERLLAERTGPIWRGRLSSSALSTATAVSALRLVDAAAHAERIGAGATWLAATQLADGCWGDTPASPGNLSTTLLCWSVLAALDDDRGTASPAVARAAAWIAARAGSTAPADLAAALERIYGRDRTFSVPILVHTALCGRLGDVRSAATWKPIPQLPFELATLPRQAFRLVDMQVVSYALPALIAIGQVRHAHRPAFFPWRSLRDMARGPTLRTLRAIQPDGGGFLEATPLTSFVTMSLAGMGLAGHPVAVEGTGFLVASQRPDGSWPIDTDLATWCTTLSVGALAAGGRLGERLSAGDRRAIREWLLGQQWKRVHPYTGAAPGGWAWTDLPGGVPDADDTSGASTWPTATAVSPPSAAAGAGSPSTRPAPTSPPTFSGRPTPGAGSPASPPIHDCPGRWPRRAGTSTPRAAPTGHGGRCGSGTRPIPSRPTRSTARRRWCSPRTTAAVRSGCSTSRRSMVPSPAPRERNRRSRRRRRRSRHSPRSRRAVARGPSSPRGPARRRPGAWPGSSSAPMAGGSFLRPRSASISPSSGTTRRSIPSSSPSRRSSVPAVSGKAAERG